MAIYQLRARNTRIRETIRYDLSIPLPHMGIFSLSLNKWIKQKTQQNNSLTRLDLDYFGIPPWKYRPHFISEALVSITWVTVYHYNSFVPPNEAYYHEIMWPVAKQIQAVVTNQKKIARFSNADIWSRQGTIQIR